MSKYIFFSALVAFTFSACTKNTADHNAAIIGRWKFVKEEQATFTPDGKVENFTWSNDSVSYMFAYRGYLVIKYGLSDTMWYSLIGGNILRIMTPSNIYDDTILSLTDKNFTFKESHVQLNGNRTESVIFLER